jgi:hypothetical protein
MRHTYNHWEETPKPTLDWEENPEHSAPATPNKLTRPTPPTLCEAIDSIRLTPMQWMRILRLIIGLGLAAGLANGTQSSRPNNYQPVPQSSEFIYQQPNINIQTED